MGELSPEAGVGELTVAVNEGGCESHGGQFFTSHLESCEDKTLV